MSLGGIIKITFHGTSLKGRISDCKDFEATVVLVYERGQAVGELCDVI